MLITLAALPGVAAAERSCAEWQAVLESVEGPVELRRGTSAAWAPARAEQRVCTGDAIRTRASGRAAIRLPDQTLVRIDRESSITFAEPDDGTGSLLDLLRGVINVISRDPRSLRFDTPYANAGLEGTEFTIEALETQTRITVVEGEVVVANAGTRVNVGRDETATARASGPISTAPARDAFARARWAAYFPPILPPPLPEPDAAPAASPRADFLVRRAAARGAVGRFTDAEADVSAALALEPANAAALALRAPLALAAGDKKAALGAARSAIEADPGSAPAGIALSYAEQAVFDYKAAAEAARRATAAEPGNALAWARLAEAELATGADRDALASAERAASVDPNLAQVHIVHGFAHLRLADSARAIRAFERAVRLEQSAPLPRIGLGLASIRAGDLEQGRAALEVAVALDPASASLRNQIARIYAAEHRDELAATQTELARRLDPTDPTPYLYDALGKQQRNELVAALEDLQTSARLDGETGLFRSSFHLGEDLGVRSAGFGRLYRDLDFEQLALLRGWQASIRDARDHAPKRLLADVYSTRPRHQIARVNALWQSQLLQPINVRPVPPQLAEANMFILGAAGPSELAFDEFGPLVRRDGTTLQGSAVAGSHATRGADFELAGLQGGLSYSLGGFAFESSGFRENNDIDQRVANALVQYRAGPATSVFGELRTATTDKGDLSLRFNSEFLPALRQHDDVDSARVGLRREVGDRSTVLAAAIRDEIDSTAETGPSFSAESHSHSDTLDLAYLRTRDAWQLTSGIRHFEQSTMGTSSLVPDSARMRSAYVYADLHASPELMWTFGLSAESLDDGEDDTGRLNPKFGVTWQLDPATKLRAAAFRTLQGPLISKQIIQPRLEPTHVAGFNQFFFGSEGQRADRLGIGLDRRLGERLDAGIEISGRETSTPVTTSFADEAPFTEHIDGRERALHSYVYWTPSNTLGVSASYNYEEIDYGTRVFSEGYARLETHRLPVAVNWFHTPRLKTRVTASLVDQQGIFGAVPWDPLVPGEHGRDRFTVVDFSMSYRLPRRLGRISLQARNLFDKRFNFQDVDPENTRYFPERSLALRLTISY